MIAEIKDRFERILIQVREFETLLKNENNVSILKPQLFDFARFVYLKQGNLFILNQLIEEFKSRNITYIENNILLNDLNELVKKYNFTFIQIMLDAKLSAKNNRLSASKQISNLKYTVKQQKYIEFERLQFETKGNISSKYQQLKGTLFMYLDLMLFYNTSYKDKNELDIPNFSDDKIKFYNSLYYGRPTLEKWIQYPSTEFLEFHKNENRKYIEKIEKIQQKLFNQALNNEIEILVQDLNKGNRLLNYKRFLDLTEDFINGKITDIDLKRLSVFMLIDRPDKVMIELDNIFMEKSIDFKSYLPYDGPNKRKSPRFSAELLILFGTEINKILKIYNNQIAKLDLNGLNFTFDKKIIPKHRTNSFKFIQSSTSKMKLSTILMQLNTKFHIVKLNKRYFDELMEVLTCSDYTKLDLKVKIDCKTSVFSYIFKQLKPFFTNLTAQQIEDSKLFLTKNKNTLLTATNFNKSGASDLIEKEEINRIIKSI